MVGEGCRSCGVCVVDLVGYLSTPHTSARRPTPQHPSSPTHSKPPPPPPPPPQTRTWNPSTTLCTVGRTSANTASCVDSGPKTPSSSKNLGVAAPPTPSPSLPLTPSFLAPGAGTGGRRMTSVGEALALVTAGAAVEGLDGRMRQRTRMLPRISCWCVVCRGWGFVGGVRGGGIACLSVCPSSLLCVHTHTYIYYIYTFIYVYIYAGE